MYPDLEYALKKRYSLMIAYRLLVLFLIVLGTIPLSKLLIEGFVVIPFYTNRGFIPRNTTTWTDLIVNHLPTSGGYFIAALLLTVMQQRLVFWLTPLPRPQCPQCGYNIKKLSEPRCPECGMDLPEGLVKQPDSD